MKLYCLFCIKSIQYIHKWPGQLLRPEDLICVFNAYSMFGLFIDGDSWNKALMQSCIIEVPLQLKIKSTICLYFLLQLRQLNSHTLFNQVTINLVKMQCSELFGKTKTNLCISCNSHWGPGSHFFTQPTRSQFRILNTMS